jgi:hypothetical protein
MDYTRVKLLNYIASAAPARWRWPPRSWLAPQEPKKGGYKEMSSILAAWPIAPSYFSPSAGGGVELRGLSQWEQLYTGAQINFWRFYSIFNLWPKTVHMHQRVETGESADWDFRISWPIGNQLFLVCGRKRPIAARRITNCDRNLKCQWKWDEF